MKRMTVLTTILAIALALGLPIQTAQAQSRRINLRYHYIALRQAVCVQQWNRAIALVDQMIASGQLPPPQVDQMVAYRYYLEQYRRNETRFSTIPNCEGARGGTPSEPTQLPAVNRSRDPRLPGS